MGNALQTRIDKKASDEADKDFSSQRRKRSRITKVAEVKVHQWTFSTEVK
jgi:hypothetical protein